MSADLVLISFSGEPVGKGRPRFVRATGRVYTPAATAKYEAALRYAAQQAMGDRAPFDCALRVEITAAFPVPMSWSKKKKAAALAGAIYHTSRPDADNLIKNLDSFNEIIWRDDSLVADVRCVKIYSEHPGLTITIEPIGVPSAVAPSRATTEPAPFPLFGEEAEAPLFARGAA